MSSIADITIIGAGPVGLYASFYAGLRSMSVRIVDALPEVGGQLTALYPKKNIYDVAGYPKILAEDLVKALLEQAMQYNPTILTNSKIVSLDRKNEHIVLTTFEGKEYLSKKVLISAGVGAFTPRKLANKEFEKWEGKRLYYFVKDPTHFYGKKLLIVGGGDSAMDWAMALADHADLTLIHRRDKFVAHEDSVAKVFSYGFPIKTFWEIKDLLSEEGKLKYAIIINNKTKEEEKIEVDDVLCNLGFLTNLGPIKEWGINLKRNSILVDSYMRTNLDGVYASGDITSHESKLKLIATGFGEAAIAVNHAKVMIDPKSSFFPGHSSNKDS